MSSIIAFFTTGPGKVVVGWLLNKLWSFADSTVRDALAKAQWESHVKKTLDEYAKVIEEAKTKASDGLTDEERDEIRKKKTELEEALINNRP